MASEEFILTPPFLGHKENMSLRIYFSWGFVWFLDLIFTLQNLWLKKTVYNQYFDSLLMVSGEE